MIYQSYAPLIGQKPPKKLDGVAVVSAIMGAEDPRKAAEHLHSLITGSPAFTSFQPPPNIADWAKAERVKELLDSVPKIIKKVSEVNPLCHNMTNLVVQNIAANVALSM